MSGAVSAAGQVSAAPWLADSWSALLTVGSFIVIGIIVLFIVTEPLWFVFRALLMVAILIAEQLGVLRRWAADETGWRRWNRHRKRLASRQVQEDRAAILRG